MLESHLSQPVSLETWTPEVSVAWTCGSPPCRADFSSSRLGSANAIMREQSIDKTFPSAQSVASRWTGRFRAPVTGSCQLTLSGTLGMAKLYIDSAQVHSRPYPHESAWGMYLHERDGEKMAC